MQQGATTMRRLVMRGLEITALATAICLTGASAHAQRKPKKPAASQSGGGSGPVDMDADQPLDQQIQQQVQKEEQQTQKKRRAAAPVDNSPPPSAGQPTDAASQARRLYQAEKWWESAKALYRVYTGETGDDEGNKQIAQFDLAKALYKLKFYQGAYSIFSEIADKPNHLKYNETLLWLAKLATDLPEPADIIERVGKYNEEHVAKFDNNEQADLYWQLNYLLGRYKYRNGQFPEALALFEKVNRKSKYYVESQFFGGISNVQMRQSKPAVQAFQRILGAIEDGDVPAEDEARFRDLAYLSMARTFYSASIRVDDTTNQPTVDQTRLSAAVKYWNKEIGRAHV